MNNLQKGCLMCKKLFSKPYTESLKDWTNRHKYCSRVCARNAPVSKETRQKMRLKRIGRKPWNAGIKLDEAHRKALRVKHKPLSEATKEKMRGRRPWNKIGEGVTSINERIRKSPGYKLWRKLVYERDGYVCVKCGAKNSKGCKVTLHADHIKPFALYPELRFEVSNGQTLCVPCHRDTESYGINQHTYPQFKSNKIAKNTNAT